jgi:hypothetical protein
MAQNLEVVSDLKHSNNNLPLINASRPLIRDNGTKVAIIACVDVVVMKTSICQESCDASKLICDEVKFINLFKIYNNISHTFNLQFPVSFVSSSQLLFR